MTLQKDGENAMEKTIVSKGGILLKMKRTITLKNKKLVIYIFWAHDESRRLGEFVIHKTFEAMRDKGK